MAVPKRRTSNSVSRKRRGHLKAHTATFVECGNCGELRIAHNICGKCHFYNGKVIENYSKKAEI